MIKLNYSVRPYIKGSTGQVGLKVRWNNSNSVVSFFTSVWAEPDKWDQDLMKAKRGTTHYVRDMKFTYVEINEEIAEYREEIEGVFDKCALKNTVPTTDELKTMVKQELSGPFHRFPSLSVNPAFPYQAEIPEDRSPARFFRSLPP